MADIDDRGQIILVAAFALGVIFIALAVVVNAAIYTENLATRREAASGGDALNYRHEVAQNVGRALENINDEYTGTDEAELETRAKSNISNISIQGGQQKAHIGRVVAVRNVGSLVDGTRFVNRTSDFTNSSNATTWTVVESIPESHGMRSLELNITSTSALASSRSDAFKIVLNDSSNLWNMSVYNPSGNTVNITVTNGKGREATCSMSVSPPFRIDVTGGSVVPRPAATEEPCHALRITDGKSMWFGTGINSSYSMEFYNADEIKGGYEGVANGEVDHSLPNKTSNTNSAIYSLVVRYAYHTPTLHYETDIRVAPGEPEA